MATLLRYLKSPWTVILTISVLLFTFWDGPVFTATSLSHGGRLLVSYTFIPIAVAAVLLWKRQWSWISLSYYALGLALIKMVITMGVYLWVIPRGARVEARPVDTSRSVSAKQLYREAAMGPYGTIQLTVHGPPGGGHYAAAILDVRRGKRASRARYDITVIADGIRPELVTATVQDSVLLVNETSTFHTYSLSDSAGQLLQVPLPPELRVARTLQRSGVFVSRCTDQHPNESMRLLVFSHPYHATGMPGEITVLDSVPPGSYRLGVWHHGLRSPDTVLDVTVSPHETTAVSLDVTQDAGT